MQTLMRGMERERGCLVIYPERRMGISGRSILRPNGDSGGDKLGQQSVVTYHFRVKLVIKCSNLGTYLWVTSWLSSKSTVSPYGTRQNLISRQANRQAGITVARISLSLSLSLSTRLSESVSCIVLNRRIDRLIDRV